MRCSNCWEEISQPPLDSTELQIHWVFGGFEVCGVCHAILQELEPVE